jgi:UDP-N-acetylmuramoylalanine--D-glutamate ligase
VIHELALRGEVAVVGLGRSGRAVSLLLHRAGAAVYASDAGSGAFVQRTVAELSALGIAAQAGGHDLDRVGRASVVVASPGVPPDAAPLACATARGVPIVSEVEVALGSLRNTRFIAVTGTNGKSTVTALADHLLRALGVDAVAAGNIGLALSEVALRDAPPAWVALEVSSFQLHDTPSLAPAVGVLTNLAPDHLDRYRSVEDYYNDKQRLFANATDASAWVTNADDAEVLRRTAGVRGRHLRFSLRDRGGDAFLSAAGELVVLGTPLLGRAALPLLGDHNVANALAASLAVLTSGAAPDGTGARHAIARALGTFRGMPHRLEVVADRGGVQWINDSKATNVSSARVAIEGMTRPSVVLLGGRHKGEPYSGLVDVLSRHASLVIAYGEAAPRIVADLAGLAGRVPVERLGSSFDEVIARARVAARPGDAVLLSPACSSFDMFTNYEERGAAFRAAAGAGGDPAEVRP